MSRRTVHDALRAASEITGYRVADIKARKRNHVELHDTRVAVMVVARDHLDKSFKMIAHVLDRDHTSVMSSLERRRDREGVQLLVAQIIEHLEKPTFIERMLPCRDHQHA